MTLANCITLWVVTKRGGPQSQTDLGSNSDFAAHIKAILSKVLYRSEPQFLLQTEKLSECSVGVETAHTKENSQNSPCIHILILC